MRTPIAIMLLIALATLVGCNDRATRSSSSGDTTTPRSVVAEPAGPPPIVTRAAPALPPIDDTPPQLQSMPGIISPAAAREIQEEQLRQWQGRFDKEARDPSWAQDMETQLLTLEQPQGLDFPIATRIATECRTRTCRQQFEFSQGGNIDGWLNDYVLALGPHLSAMRVITVPDPNGGISLLVFASEQ